MRRSRGRELQTLRLFATLGFLTLLAVLLMKVVLFGPAQDRTKMAFDAPQAGLRVEVPKILTTGAESAENTDILLDHRGPAASSKPTSKKADSSHK